MMKRRFVMSWMWLVLTALLASTFACNKQTGLNTSVIEQTPYLSLPPQVQVLHVLDLTRFRRLEFYPDMVNLLRKDPDTSSVMRALEEKIRFMPLDKIDLLVIASTSAAPSEIQFGNSIFIARGDYSQKDALLNRLHQWLSDEFLINPAPFATREDPATGAKIFQTKGQSQYNERIIYELNFAFPSDNLMIFSFNSALFNQTLQVIGGNLEGIKTDENWQRILQRPDIGTMFWGAGTVNPRLIDALQSTGTLPHMGNAREFYYNISTGPSFKFELGFFCETISKAEELTGDFKQNQAMLQQMINATMLGPGVQTYTLGSLVDRLFISTTLETSQINLTLSADQREQLMIDMQKYFERETEALGR